MEMQWWGKALPLASQHVAGQCLTPLWGDRGAPHTWGRGRPLGPSLPPWSRACFKQVAQGFTCQVLSISKAGELTGSLDNLFQCLAMFMVKKFLIIPNLNFPCTNFCLLLLLLPPCASERFGSVFSVPSPWLQSLSRRNGMKERVLKWKQTSVFNSFNTC